MTTTHPSDDELGPDDDNPVCRRCRVRQHHRCEVEHGRWCQCWCFDGVFHPLLPGLVWPGVAT